VKRCRERAEQAVALELSIATGSTCPMMSGEANTCRRLRYAVRPTNLAGIARGTLEQHIDG